MGQGTKFSKAIATRGGRLQFITKKDIENKSILSKKILDDMKTKNIKYTTKDIIFVAALKNGNYIFLEQKNLNHIIDNHSDDFKRAFGISKGNVSKFLSDTINNGKLISTKYQLKDGKEYFSNVYYFNEKYYAVYGIASNGYIVTAHPLRRELWKK